MRLEWKRARWLASKTGLQKAASATTDGLDNRWSSGVGTEGSLARAAAKRQHPGAQQFQTSDARHGVPDPAQCNARYRVR